MGLPFGVADAYRCGSLASGANGARGATFDPSASCPASAMIRNNKPGRELMADEFPSVTRLAAMATVAFGLVGLFLIGVVVGIAATTGEPVILNPRRFGESWTEAVLFAVILGGSCYGTAVLDWLYRR